MTTRTGSCLCGARRYQIEGDLDGVWMCHCSLCRKATGSTGNAILIVPRDRFRWLSGADHCDTYKLRETYTVTRCRTWGTALPAEADEKNVYVTAGTLNDPLDAGVINRLFCASRADWDHDAPDVRCFDERSR